MNYTTPHYIKVNIDIQSRVVKTMNYTTPHYIKVNIDIQSRVLKL